VRGLAVASLLAAGALVAFDVVAPLLHLAPVVITGSSMAPAIPRGSLVIIEPTAPETLAVGEVVTLRLESGALVTHRITRLATLGGERYVETRGDANRDADPVLQPVSSIIGRVAVTVPVVGFVDWLIARPIGWFTAGSIAALLVVCAWLLDELASSRGDEPPRPTLSVAG
jgi:signal peptidase